MISYRRMYTRFQRHWDKVRMYYEHGVTTRPANYAHMMMSHLDVRATDIELGDKVNSCHFKPTNIYTKSYFPAEMEIY